MTSRPDREPDAEATRPYRIFNATLARRQPLSPDMARLTFAGADIADMATRAPDQRIKLFFPSPDGAPAALSDRADWYERHLATPQSQRSRMRSYTIRTLRAVACEVDIDFVLHGDDGPASRWAATSEPGTPIQILAPDRRFQGDPGGYEWKPPANVEHVLLMADETALPAAAGILESLVRSDRPPMVQAFFEVAAAGCEIDLPRTPQHFDIRWLFRRDGAAPESAYGGRLLACLDEFQLPIGLRSESEVEATESADGDELLWDRAGMSEGAFYAWIAGETTAVSRIRTILLKERGIDRAAMNLMGYWRHGRIRH